MRVAILTISDSVSRGTSKDASGPDVRDRCVQRAWTVTAEEVFPDDLVAIRDRLISLADSGAVDLILTTGGTEIGPRDVTPEATTQACEKLLPGLSELMREEGRKKNSPRRAVTRSRRCSRSRVDREFVRQSARRSGIAGLGCGNFCPTPLQVLGGARHDRFVNFHLPFLISNGSCSPPLQRRGFSSC